MRRKGTHTIIVSAKNITLFSPTTDNNIAAAGAGALGEALKVNTSLTVLGLESKYNQPHQCIYNSLLFLSNKTNRKHYWVRRGSVVEQSIEG